MQQKYVIYGCHHIHLDSGALDVSVCLLLGLGPAWDHRITRLENRNDDKKLKKNSV